MSVKRLLTEMDSYEMSAWQAFLMADAQERTVRQKVATEDAKFED